MSGILASVDQRTQLVGENRLELLMFKLGTRHTFAINVFKVREVITVPHLNKMPGSHDNLKGVTNYRGTSIPIIDLRQAIKLPKTKSEKGSNNVIITEYNRSVQGFLIGDVMSIVNTSWSDIQAPPTAIGKNNYLTAITQIEINGQKEIVEIIDVEKVLAEIIEYDIHISEEILDEEVVRHLHGQTVLVVDDSATARWQIRDTLKQLGINIIERRDGLMALKLLQEWAGQGKNINEQILMMFTDAEMPEMDGYRLTAEVRADKRMSDLFIALNTSLSGSFNEAMVKKVGCNRFISKFQPDLLVDVVQQRMREKLQSKEHQ
ncbi:chemotaxis protein CheV [Aliiglaciecola lipolytica]|uniref:Two-component system, chemotaxis family, response regulator CheV n=1 Tax=Aliiglaciecola lipolytica E3 TaxID=1127673 RepID=K6XWB1_9ALTE|nr:chemotaxis protein CheV [Aliiglaciecola lipolytica]GAC15936.1 two-component system, chemotaxis family, response regulator CheV [Aliiglaciecola lipolytica E3]